MDSTSSISHSYADLWISPTPYENESSTKIWTREEYLELTRGPKHLPIILVLPLTIIYAAIFVPGVVGNVLVCWVIAKNAAMHTATNYYLFSLAVSDLLLLIFGLPNDLAVFWQQYPWVLGEAACKMRALISEMMSYTSVLTIVAFSMERFLAICYPLYSYQMSGLKRAIRIIAAIWVVALICSIPFAMYSTVDYVFYPPDSDQILLESAFCGMFDYNIPANFPVYELSSFFFFLVPMVIILVLYVRMGIVIKSRQRNIIGENVEGSLSETRSLNSKKAIIRMLTTVVVAFFLCWAPFHLQRLLYVYGRDWEHYFVTNEWVFVVTGCLYYLSSTVNPILYNVMSAKYREAFKDTLCCGRRSSSRASFRDNYTDSTMLFRGRSTLLHHSTQRRSTPECEETIINETSPTLDAPVMVSSNGRSSLLSRWTTLPEETSEETRFARDFETCI